MLQRKRVGVRLTGSGMRGAQGCHRSCLIEPDESIELLRQRRLSVMTRQFRIGPVDDTDKSLESWLDESAAQRFVAPQIEQESRHMRVVAQTFVALSMRGTHSLHLHIA